MIYFDNAATSKFKPKTMIKAVVRELENSANGGRSGHDDAVKTAIAVSDVRTYFSQKFNCNEIIFTKNCTEALNIVIFGTARKGGHVITTVNEHNSTLRPLFKLKKEVVIDLSVVNPDKNLTVSAEHIERLIRPETYLIAVNAVSNVTGAVCDIAAVGAVAQKYGVLLLVDGAQAIPYFDVDMKKLNISYLACAGHKGLHGPQGTGFLAVNDMRELRPLLYGGTGTNSDSVYQPRVLPESLEAGTLNSAGIIGLGEGAKWTYAHLDKIMKKTSEISDEILYGLKKIKNVEVYTPDGAACGVISFNINGMSSAETGDILNSEYGIAVRTGLHCAPLIHNHLGTLESGAVRVSVGYNNTSRDAEKLLRAVKEISCGKSTAT